jgi:hypothetical protein
MDGTRGASHLFPGPPMGEKVKPAFRRPLFLLHVATVITGRVGCNGRPNYRMAKELPLSSSPHVDWS